MVHGTDRLSEFEAHYRRKAFRDFSYREALSLFKALWAKVRAPAVGQWRDGAEVQPVGPVRGDEAAQGVLHHLRVGVDQLEYDAAFLGLMEALADAAT